MMAWSWSDIGKSIADVAPTIAGVLVNVVAPGAGGAASVVAKAGINALMTALGVAGDPADQATIDATQSTLTTANPELLLRIKEADNKFKNDMAELGVRLEEIAAADRGSARERHIAVKDRTPAILSYFMFGVFAITSGTVFLTAILGLLNLGSVEAGLVGTIVGAVISEFKSMTSFWFGGTRSGSLKNESIADLSKIASK